MNQFIFYTVKEFNDLLNILLKKTEKETFRVNYSEEMNMEIIECHSSKGINCTPLQEILPVFEKHLNISVKEFEITEMDDDGIGYLFHLDISVKIDLITLPFVPTL